MLARPEALDSSNAFVGAGLRPAPGPSVDYCAQGHREHSGRGGPDCRASFKLALWAPLTPVTPDAPAT
jgi:hypothetical protein